MPVFQDQIGIEIELDSVPTRIVSLVPSQTELLHYLGLEGKVVGITKFCIHPEDWFETKNRVGGTKTVNLEKIRDLNPDLIICNKEENVKEQVAMLREIAPVWTSDVNSIDDALDLILNLGKILDKENESFKLLKVVEGSLNSIPKKRLGTCLYLVWDEPAFVVGKGTYINDVLARFGFENLCQTSRYPDLSSMKFETDPDYIFLSSEPFPFGEEHIQKFQQRYPNSKIKLVDGEMFSWYGSRMRALYPYYSELMNELKIDL